MRPVNVTAFFIIMLTAYTGANIYLGNRLFLCARVINPKTGAAIFTAIYTAVALSVTLNFVPLATLPTVIKDALRYAGACWTGFFIYALMLFIVTDAAITAGRLFKLIPSPVPPGIRLYSGLAAVTLATALATYGIANANKISVTSYNVGMDNKTLPGGMKIALASDLHIGAAGSEGRLPKIIDALNAQKPDLICLAGDIFNDNYRSISNPDLTSELLRSLNATHGVYACLGNHDAGKSAGEMLDFLARSNIKPLTDEFDIVNGQVAVIGRLDPRPIGGLGRMRRAPISEIMTRSVNGSPITLTNTQNARGTPKKQLTVNVSVPIIIIDHNPKSIHEYGNEVDLVLSGHTHGGQLFPTNLFTKAIYTADYGRYQKEPGAPVLIVTSGAGTWGPPMRVGTRGEIVCVTLYSNHAP
jgi:predicted MPP superfamily phosphohydrolase